jgi:hypothetical protein
MNMQAMMQQAQKIQKDMMKAKKEIEEKTYIDTESFVTVEMKGTKEIKKVSIDMDSLEKEDIEMLEDLICVAVNNNIKKIDKETESKMGRFSGISGLL